MKLEGANEERGPWNSWPSSAGEFAARWNDLSEDAREEAVRQIVEFGQFHHRYASAPADVPQPRPDRTTIITEALRQFVVIDVRPADGMAWMRVGSIGDRVTRVIALDRSEREAVATALLPESHVEASER